MIRAIKADDFEQLHKIYMRFYQDEMEFPNFIEHYLCAFVVIDDNDKIISAGGVRTIAESIVLTNQAMPARARIRALHEILEASRFVTSRSGYKNLNAFVRDGDWKNHLMKYGFVPDEVLSLEVNNG